MMSRIFSIITCRDYTFFATILFFGAISILFTFPILEGDFFWHVRTGQWIWEHKSLPAADPFSHINSYITPTEHFIARSKFLLTQYWLGQLGLFGTWKMGGEAGMVILRTVIYSGILAFTYWWLRREKNGIIPLATIFVIGNTLVIYSNERPQIFSFLFMALMLYLLERLITSCRTSRTTDAALLLFIMVAWSNCHGSFLLGDVVIALYGAGHLLSSLLRGSKLNFTLLAILSAAIMITALNPNGFAALTAISDVDKAYLDNIAEYASPLRLAIDHHVFHYSFWFLLAVAFVTIVLNFRSMALHHIAVIISLAALSLTAIRYIPFFVLAAPLVAIYLPDKKSAGIYRILPLVIILLWLGAMDFKNVLKFRAAKFFPKNAIQFINSTKPSGKIFNQMLWGGYLMCYTDYPVFIDGRSLSEKLTLLHNQVLAGSNWKELLSMYQINIIFIPGMGQLSMQPYPILLQLRNDNDWALVYQDDEALMFMRDIPQNRDFLARHAISKDRIMKHIISRQEWQLKYEM